MLNLVQYLVFFVSKGNTCDVPNVKCYIWVNFTQVDDISIINKIDKIIDKGDGLDKGLFRGAINTGTVNDQSIYLKYMPINNW